MKQFLVVAAVLVMIGLNAPASHRAAGQVTQSQSPQQARRMSMIMTVRAINVAEVDYQMATGQYADWETLAESEGLHKLGVNVPLQTDLRVFGDPEGKIFSVALKDTLDPCLYTVFSNETGILHEDVVAGGCPTK